MADQRRGLLLGVAAYVLWGGFPLYFPLLEPAGAFEILAHRIVWSAVTMGVLVVVLGRAPQVRAALRDRRTLVLLSFAAVAITCNWATYIWGVNHGRVVETSLGYFITPLVSVLFGIVVLGERLRHLQWGALGLGTLAVVILTVDYGRPPWIALALAFSFGTYGLIKKQANVGAVESLAVETALVAPFAAAYVVFLIVGGTSTFGSHGADHSVLLLTTGIVTAIPLICFGGAAIRVPMVTLGLLQYLAPILQFGLGLLHFHEHMSPGRWVGFSLVWAALVVFTVEALQHHRSQLRLAALASAA